MCWAMETKAKSKNRIEVSPAESIRRIYSKIDITNVQHNDE